MKFVVKVFVKTAFKTFKVTSLGYGIWALGHQMGGHKANREWAPMYVKQINKENQ